MKGGLETTLRVLTQTPNEAATNVLVPALNSAHVAIAEGALRALMERRSPAGQKELVHRWQSIDSRWKTIVAEYPGRLNAAIRQALLGTDPALCAAGCAAVLDLREFDLIPALVTAAEDENNPQAPLVAHTLLELSELLYQELATPRDYRKRRDPQLIRDHVVSSLELSLGRFNRHKRSEIVEAFLMLANRDNSVLKKTLQDPFAGSFLCIMETVSRSPKPGVMRLLLSYLDDPHAPPAAIQVMARRSDKVFLGHLLQKIGFEPSAAARNNLKRIDWVPWLADEAALATLNDLDDAGQHAAMQMALATSANRLDKFRLIQQLLIKGNVGGRRAAAEALADFKGTEANDLAQRALQDEDPPVQAHILRQLRQRGLPGALGKLLEMLDSPHEVIRSAARECLEEFSFERFLTAFDMLEEQVRASTGQLVRKVDPLAGRKLAEEIASKSRSRRLRALDMSTAMDLVTEVEGQVIRLLSDEDYLVRVAAARALAQCNTPRAREALREALLDRSISVRDEAERSLQQLALPLKTLGPTGPASMAAWMVSAGETLPGYPPLEARG